MMFIDDTQNNVGSAKHDPVTADEMAYALIADGCRRFLEGKIKEHSTYKFYTGFQVRVFISAAQYQKIHACAAQVWDNPLIVNGKHIGDWSISYFHGKWSCMIILTLSDEFKQKHRLVKRFAQLAAHPLDKTVKVQTCTCGFPMVQPITYADSETPQWLCEHCWMKQDPWMNL